MRSRIVVFVDVSGISKKSCIFGGISACTCILVMCEDIKGVREASVMYIPMKVDIRVPTLTSMASQYT